MGGAWEHPCVRGASIPQRLGSPISASLLSSAPDGLSVRWPLVLQLLPVSVFLSVQWEWQRNLWGVRKVLCTRNTDISMYWKVGSNETRNTVCLAQCPECRKGSVSVSVHCGHRHSPPPPPPPLRHHHTWPHTWPHRAYCLNIARMHLVNSCH